jgi:hypothetical protein
MYVFFLKNSRYYFLILLLISFLFLFRFDSFQDFLLNIDEAEWLYCLKRCVSNSVPFLGFDPHTTGPFSIYLLTPLYFLNPELSVVGLRLYGLLFMVLFSFLVFNMLAKKQKMEYALVFTTFLLIRDKDFFAFNTEWMLIPFIFLLVFLSKMQLNSKNKQLLFILALLNVILPLIKFQSILIVFFITLFLVIQFYKKKDFLSLKWYLLFNVLVVLFSLIVIEFSTGLKDFYYYYIHRNVAYASSFATKSIKVVVIEYFYLLFKYFSYHLFFIVFLFFSLLFSKKNHFFQLINTIRFELLFTLVCLLTVFLPKNNFLHYYQFLFVPFTFLIVKLLFLMHKNKFINLLFLFSFFLIPFGIRSLDQLYDKYIKGSLTNVMYYERVNTDGLQSILNAIPTNRSIFVFGWHKALPLYYKLQNSNTFSNASGHTSYLIDLKQNELIFQKEKKNVIDVINRSDIVVDAENVLVQLRDKDIYALLKQDFNLIKDTPTSKVFKRKSG